MSKLESSDDYFCEQVVNTIATLSVCTLPCDIQIELDEYYDAQSKGIDIFTELDMQTQTVLRNL